MTPTIVFAPRVLDVIWQAADSHGSRAHDEAAGGILIGKRAGDRIVILAATEPGPNAHDRRVGFALDMDYANTTLQEWFDRDADADIAGVWHTHPPDLAELTPEDVAAAYTLRDDAGREVVSAIAVASPEGAAVTCFYLDAAATPPAAPVPVRYAEGEDGAPVVVPIPQTIAVPPAPLAHASETTAEPPTPPASAASTPAPQPSRGRAIAAGLGVLLLLLVAAGLLRVFTAGESGGSTAQSTPEALSSVVAVVAQSATAPPAATQTPTPAPTDTPAPSPTTQPTASPTTQPTASPTTAATASPTPEPATPTAAATATPEGPLPYLLRFEPMPAARRAAFLARARAADCATCYNVDLISPQPYVELRVRIDDEDPPALRTFRVPSLAFVEPRDEPRTLQVFDLEGNPASPPISVEVAPGSYYILRIVAR